MLALLYGAESGTPDCCCNPLISLFMAISSRSVEEFRFPSFPFGSFSDEELAFPASVLMEVSLVGASIFSPSDSVAAFQAKISRFQRVRGAKPLRAKLESLDSFLSGIALGSPNFVQKSLRGTCTAVAIQSSLVEIDWRSGERKAQYSYALEVKVSSSRSTFLKKQNSRNLRI